MSCTTPISLFTAMTLTSSVGTVQRRAQRVGIQQPVGAHRQEHRLEALVGQVGHRFEDAFVLGRHRDDAPALVPGRRREAGRALDGDVVALGGAGGEHDLLGVRADQRGDLRARVLALLALIFVFVLSVAVPAGAQTAPTKPLTIEAIYQPGGLGGRGPETVEWSPDGTKLSFVQRDEKGENGELWYVDVATGEKKVLVSAAKLASLAPDVNKVKNEREKERLTRYHVASYLWAPDSKHLIFDSQGQLWLYDLGTETAVQFTSAPDPSGDPKFSPDGNHVAYVRKHNLYVRPVNGKERKTAHQRYRRQSFQRRY